MSLARRAAKRDDTEPEIVQAFITAPARHPAILSVSVQKLSGVGVPDLLVGITFTDGAKRWELVEAKSEGGALTPEQKAWMRTAQGPKPFLAYSGTDVDGILRWLIASWTEDRAA